MDKRKVYSIVLKIIALLGVIIVMAVMINSLFPVVQNNDNSDKPVDIKPELVVVSLEALSPGKMKIVKWAGKSVGIVKRINPPSKFQWGEPLNSQWRSVKADYFVFYNSVGVAQCPLYLMPSGEQLKDTCTGVLYDVVGKRVKGSGGMLEIPPHYFDNKGVQTITIGEWRK